MGRRLLITAVVVSAFLASVAASYAAFPGANGRIAFTSDRDENSEIYLMNPNGSGQVNLTNNPTESDSTPAWSRDGGQIAFSGDAAGARPQIYRMNANGSGRTRVTTVDAWFHDSPTWSPDGTQLAFGANLDPGSGPTDVLKVNVDGTGLTNLTFDDTANPDGGPDWSPDGSRIAFASLRGDPGSDWEIYVMNADGTNVTPVTSAAGNESSPSWSPDGQRIAFVRDICVGTCTSRIHVIDADGTDEVPLTAGSQEERTPVWSPDGTKIAFSRFHPGPNREIYVMNSDGTGQTNVTNSARDDTLPDWEPVVTGYPRPQGATPLRASLVVAYDECTAPNRTHAEPLAFGSCHPPAQTSAQATVGTPDANGAPANFVGHVRFRVAAGTAGPPEDSDVKIDLSLSDVRCRPTGARCGSANSAGPADYSGELRTAFEVRLTDRFNGATTSGGTDAGTTEDFPFEWSVPCAQTGSTSIGSSCSQLTTFKSIVPGSVMDTKRAIWEMGQVQVFDGGPDGDGDTPGGDTPFLRQGIFVP